MEEDMITSCRGYRHQNENVTATVDVVASEDTITLYLYGSSYLRMVAACAMITEIGAGVFTAPGLTECILALGVEGTKVFVEAELRCDVTPDGFAPAKPARCITTEGVQIAPNEIFTLREALNTKVWKDTGGMHCAGLWYDHRCVVVANDIGRHNAVDKVIGWMVLHHLPA